MRRLAIALLLLLLASPVIAQRVTTGGLENINYQGRCRVVDADPNGNACTETSEPHCLFYIPTGGATFTTYTCTSSTWSAITAGTGDITAVFDCASGDCATVVVENGESLSATGSGAITATAVAANSVALTTDTTGNYAAGDAEAGNATGLACSNCVALGSETTGNYATSSSEGGDATGLTCTDCVGTGDLDMTAAYTFSGLNIFEANLQLNDTTNSDYTLTIDRLGTDYTIMWDDGITERTTITDGLFAFSAGLFLSNTGTGNGITWDADDNLNSDCTGSGTPAACCTGSGTGTCDYDSAVFFGMDNSVVGPGNGKDHVVCTGFNVENCGGAVIDSNVHAYKRQLEFSFTDGANDPDYLIEWNSNYTPAYGASAGSSWRDLTYEINSDANSNDGDALLRWRAQRGDRFVYWHQAGPGSDDDDNRVCLNCDPTNDASPNVDGTLEVRQYIDWASAATLPIIKALADIVVPDDRSSQAFTSIDLDVDYSPTNNASDIGTLTGIDVQTANTGTATGVTTGRQTGVNINMTASQSSGSVTIGEVQGMRIDMDLSGAAVTSGGAQAIDILQPAGVDGQFNGIRIADLGGVGNGTYAIQIMGQTSSPNYNDGNFLFNGGEYNNGHLRFDNSDPTDIWSHPNGSSDGSRNILRARLSGGLPGSNSQGDAIVTGTGSNLYGVMMWGDDTDASTDTGTEVCALHGLTCVMAIENGDAEVACGVSPTTVTASGYYRVLCK